MSSEETESDVEMKPRERLDSVEGFAAYARRKRSRSRTARSSFGGGGGGGVSLADEVFYLASGEGKFKDIGWEHGEMVVPGNRFSWKCKWCGLVRCSGGVTRLKKHLAGAKHISPCQKVPEHVARAMKDNLLELEKKQLERQIKKHNHFTTMRPQLLCLDTSVKRGAGETNLDVQMSDATQQSERTAKSSKTAREHFRDSNQSSLFASRRSKTSMAKVSNGSHQLNGVPTRSRPSSQRSRSSYKRSSIGDQQHEAELAKQTMKGTQGTILCTITYDKDGFARKDDHWRNILGNMLHLPDLCEGGGIRTCIFDALMSGPSDSSRMFKMADVTKDTADLKDSYVDHCEEQSQSSRPDIPAKTQLNLLETETYNQNLVVTNTTKCQEVFLDILRSEKFILMCDLLGKNFQDINAEKILDFSQINLKMKNGVYEQSPGLFNQDIQQVWRKIQRTCQEMVFCASDLSNMSGDFYQKAVGEDAVHEDMVNEAVELQCEDNHLFSTEQKNSTDLDIATPFPSSESNRSAKPDQTVASILYKVFKCKQCGSEANGENSLICDECEAVYHLSCAEPAVQEIPNKSWYCASCTKGQRLSPNAVLSDVQQDHDSCVVCGRLDIIEVKEDVKEHYNIAAASGSREGSVFSMESDDPPEPSRTALSRLCKQCGTCEDEDKRFLICGHSQCPYKFYHIRCLKTSQIASLQQQNKHCWYCPSCLCRACFVDKDDDKIVLCDNCDEAYHTYCMKPPRTSIPEGQWHCIHCNVAKAKEGMRRYEEWIIQMHGKKDVKQSNEANRPMDVLLSAVEKLSSDELPVAGEENNY